MANTRIVADGPHELTPAAVTTRVVVTHAGLVLSLTKTARKSFKNNNRNNSLLFYIEVRTIREHRIQWHWVHASGINHGTLNISEKYVYTIVE